MKHLFIVFVMLAAIVTAPASFAEEAAPAGTVNLNTASTEQLQMLPRVGPALAQRIIDFREANGAFQGVEELVAVKGIGEKSLTALMPYLSVDGKTTLQAKVRLPRKTAGQSETS